MQLKPFKYEDNDIEYVVLDIDTGEYHIAEDNKFKNDAYRHAIEEEYPELRIIAYYLTAEDKKERKSLVSKMEQFGALTELYNKPIGLRRFMATLKGNKK